MVDLKPANIKLSSRGRVEVLDFGLARIASASAAALFASRQNTEDPDGAVRRR